MFTFASQQVFERVVCNMYTKLPSSQLFQPFKASGAQRWKGERGGCSCYKSYVFVRRFPNANHTIIYFNVLTSWPSCAVPQFHQQLMVWMLSDLYQEFIPTNIQLN